MFKTEHTLMSPRKNCAVSPAELRHRHQSHCLHCRLRDASSWGHKVSSSPHHHICPPPAELLRADQHIVRGPAVNVHDEAHAARVPLQRGVVQTCRERALFVIRSWVITAQLLSGHHPVGAKLSRVFCPIAASVSLLLVMSGSTSPSSS